AQQIGIVVLPGSWGSIRCSFHSLIALLVAILLAGAVYFSRDSAGLLYGDRTTLRKLRDDDSLSQCNLFSGKWVFDNKSYPLYKEKECTFMSDQLACQKFGRRDLSYQHWRWQPHHCDLPRFNATALLEGLRHKRLVFVGDSLNRGQWVSMVCLVETAIPPKLKSMHTNGSLITFKATLRLLVGPMKEYNASIEFYWAPLLVESNSDDPVAHRLPDRIVRAQSIEKHAKYWTDADVLVFNSYLWWRRPNMKVLWGSFEDSDGVYKEVEMLRSYEMAIKTWSDWLEIHINRSRTQLFFTSMSPTHERGEEWGDSRDQNCYNETEPILKEGYWGNGSDPQMMRIVEAAIDELKTRVTVAIVYQTMDITTTMTPPSQGGHKAREHHCDPAENTDKAEAAVREQYRATLRKAAQGGGGHATMYASAAKGVAKTAPLMDLTNSPLFKGCDLFSGAWVYDNGSYPIYRDKECKFMHDDLACEKYGRKDLNYQHWRWQPHACSLPRFDAKALLDRLRGKRLVFVGDSVNRNQWVSMVCLLESAIPDPKSKFKHNNGSLYSFKATEYNASIDFYWAPLLVESSADNPSRHYSEDRIIRTDSIEKHARHWSGADILVFNSYAWWRLPTLKVLNGSFDSPNSVYKEVNNLHSYEMTLRTWSDWLHANVNCSKTQLYFVSMAATHTKAQDWGLPSVQNCLNETDPVTQKGYHGSSTDPKLMSILEREISNLKSRGLEVQLLNITQLTEYRKDAHPSIYRKQWRPLPKEKLSNPSSYSDCTHWCLPGVPDVWNELLHAYILYNSYVRDSS
ncbi:hypothetical protein RJ639_037501, partial [Escallonia herrerae]